MKERPDFYVDSKGGIELDPINEVMKKLEKGAFGHETLPLLYQLPIDKLLSLKERIIKNDFGRFEFPFAQAGFEENLDEVIKNKK